MIESKQNKKIKEWKKLHKKKYRDDHGQFLVEGWHLVEEAIKSNWMIETIIVTENEEIPNSWSQNNVTLVSDDVFKDLSQTETPQGIMAVVHQKEELPKDSLRNVLLLDAVQDPGNVGTIIRSALAFNIDAVILGKGTVDLFHDKVVRATQGAIFHIPVVRGNLFHWIEELNQKDIPVYGTALEQNAKPLNSIKTNDFAVIVGNEGNGVNQDILDQVTETIYIPINENSESLNVGVATSIVLYHFTHLT